MIEVKKLTAGVFQTNTYVVISGESAVVIDPCGNAVWILGVVTEAGAELTAILLTHGHFDHTSAAGELKKLCVDADIHIHSHDAVMLNDEAKSYASLMPESFKPCKADVLVKNGDIITFGNTALTVMETPGHSGGSVMYIGDDVIFSGDTLFAGSVGRTDGWSGDSAVQAESLQKIKALQGDYRILPGHGGETTLRREKRENPFMVDSLYEF
jgi:glyoxylase-like metal-dependent hydrolase (beta-lactamase superfamily II)